MTTSNFFATALGAVLLVACGASSDERAATVAGADALSSQGSVASGGGAGPDARVAPVPTNDAPSRRTSALFASLLQQTARKSALFGQQFASWQGNGGDFDSFDSDVARALKSSIGARARHPALFGWNFETWAQGSPRLKARFQDRLIATDAAGGINTMHWPMGNFAIRCDPSPCSDNDNEEGVDPVHLVATNALFVDPRDGVERHAGDVFDERVDTLAEFLKSLRAADGSLIPMIIRPFHEMNSTNPGLTAHWWTGRNPNEYRVMWQRFVDRLRVTKHVTNVLFAFAPRGELLSSGDDTPRALYRRYWPETDASTVSARYVDIAAFDAYLEDDELATPFFDAIRTTFAFATAPARVVNRVSAVAECGRKDGTGSPTTGGPVSYENGRFWTERILSGMNADNGALWSQTAYLMTWTNGTYTTYVGAPRAQARDFVAWFEDPATLFLGEGDAF
jgi:hypothetical protein